VVLAQEAQAAPHFWAASDRHDADTPAKAYTRPRDSPYESRRRQISRVASRRVV